MKLAILSRNTKLYSTQRLVEAARERGHTVRVLDPLRCYMKIAPGDFCLQLQGQATDRRRRGDPAHRRLGHPLRHGGAAPVRADGRLSRRTAPTRSCARATSCAATRCWQGEGIGLPTTVFGDNPDDTDDLLALLGKPPHVIKLIEGTQGNGVVLAENACRPRAA